MSAWFAANDGETLVGEEGLDPELYIRKNVLLSENACQRHISELQDTQHSGQNLWPAKGRGHFYTDEKMLVLFYCAGELRPEKMPQHLL